MLYNFELYTISLYKKSEIMNTRDTASFESQDKRMLVLQ